MGPVPAGPVPSNPGMIHSSSHLIQKIFSAESFADLPSRTKAHSWCKLTGIESKQHIICFAYNTPDHFDSPQVK
jgi:hypothetical protein